MRAIVLSIRYAPHALVFEFERLKWLPIDEHEKKKKGSTTTAITKKKKALSSRETTKTTRPLVSVHETKGRVVFVVSLSHLS